MPVQAGFDGSVTSEATVVPSAMNASVIASRAPSLAMPSAAFASVEPTDAGDAITSPCVVNAPTGPA